MSTDILRVQTPEERELDRKRAKLTALEAKLVQRELELATLQAELRTFEMRYHRIVGIRYAALDEIEAQIASALARLNPKDTQAQERAARARAQAQDSGQAAGAAQETRQQNRFRPSEKLKKLYREVARLIHPDKTTDEEERLRRTQLMAEVNLAYERGDESRLQEILSGWESAPESVRGEGVGAELVRVIRKIAQCEGRLGVIEFEIAQLKASDLYQLKIKVEEAEDNGRDLLAEMASRLNEQIADARGRLDEIARRRRNA